MQRSILAYALPKSQLPPPPPPKPKAPKPKAPKTPKASASAAEEPIDLSLLPPIELDEKHGYEGLGKNRWPRKAYEIAVRLEKSGLRDLDNVKTTWQAVATAMNDSSIVANNVGVKRYDCTPKRNQAIALLWASLCLRRQS